MKISNFDLEKDGTYIIAELSTNHNQSIDIALKSIKVAKKIGANAIKLQTYSQDDMTINSDNNDFIIKGGLWDKKKLYDLYKEAKMPLEWHKQLFDYAHKIGIDIFSSPFSIENVDFLEQFNPVAYKVASFEITDYQLVEYIASKQKPIIISTGIAKLEEIEDIINICKKQGNEKVILLKCTSSYPAPLEHANLQMINFLAKKFKLPIGFSDHSLGIVAPIVAVSLGAKVIEKHFILNKNINSLDKSFSLDENEFKNMVQVIRQSEKLLKKSDFFDENIQGKNRHLSRSLYVIKDIKKGDMLNKDNIKSIRPSLGLHPKYLKEILNTKSKKDYKLGDRFLY